MKPIEVPQLARVPSFQQGDHPLISGVGGHKTKQALIMSTKVSPINITTGHVIVYCKSNQGTLGKRDVLCQTLSTNGSCLDSSWSTTVCSTMEHNCVYCILPRKEVVIFWDKRSLGLEKKNRKHKRRTTKKDLGGDSPFFSCIVLFQNQAFSLGFWRFLERWIPGKNGEGTPRKEQSTTREQTTKDKAQRQLEALPHARTPFRDSSFN